MYAVKFVNLINNNVEHYTKCNDYTDAWDKLRWEVRELEDAGWVEGEDFTAEVTEVDDNFDFENQSEWN